MMSKENFYLSWTQILEHQLFWHQENGYWGNPAPTLSLHSPTWGLTGILIAQLLCDALTCAHSRLLFWMSMDAQSIAEVTSSWLILNIRIICGLPLLCGVFSSPGFLHHPQNNIVTHQQASPLILSPDACHPLEPWQSFLSQTLIGSDPLPPEHCHHLGGPPSYLALCFDSCL